MMLVSGEYFDHLAPDSAVITLKVLEHGLDVPRFNNQTIRPITTKEHSLRVQRFVKELCPSGLEVDRLAEEAYETVTKTGVVKVLNTWDSLPERVRENWRRRVSGSPATQLWALLHDAHEALVPWGDCLRTGKTDAMREVELTIDGHVLDAIAPCVRTPSINFDLVKIADDIALYFEAMLWGGPGALDWAPAVWPQTHLITGGAERPRPSRGELIERFMPLVAPRPRECWRTEVEELLS